MLNAHFPPLSIRLHKLLSSVLGSFVIPIAESWYPLVGTMHTTAHSCMLGWYEYKHNLPIVLKALFDVDSVGQNVNGITSEQQLVLVCRRC